METGHTYKTCIYCGKVKKLEDFDLNIAPEDIEDEDPFHVNKECKECYDYGIKEKHRNKVRDRIRGNALLIQKRVDLIYRQPQVTGHVKRCRFCDSNTGCGCRDTDSDGYGYGKRG